ncbi:MAG: RsmB/NOP family class I SAM-dependent RNA methyltransferase [Opitutales bacterium]|jgi:16S rRNA (cytosine967-C5)-methyltransferase
MEDREPGELKVAIDLLVHWSKGQRHLDDLLEGAGLGRIRWLVMDLFRNWLVVESILGRRLRRNPRPVAHNLLRLSVAECLNREAAIHPRIVHHAVEQARSLGLGKAECGFINGVLRAILREPEGLEAGSLEETHPDWLVQRWGKQFGMESTQRLLKWNQEIPELRLRADRCPDYAQESNWEGTYTVTRSRFAEALKDLGSGRVYMQDPFARIPVELLAVRPGERVADLCAAPGGKTRLLASGMSGQGTLLAIDKPGHRLDRLKDNLARAGHAWVKVVGARLEDFSPDRVADETGGAGFDALLIDVPCSNTGVIQKRPDVKLRLQPDSIGRHAVQQLALLVLASRWVKKGGRMVYSTCSIETEENGGVIDQFLAMEPEWRLDRSVMSYSWECDHDGGGAFLLTRAVPE